jgi:hypothetical protein
VIVGASATLTGRLTCADEEAAAGKQVSLYVRGRSGVRSKAAVETTAKDGSFQLTSSALAVDTRFTALIAGSRQARAVVEVAPQITLSGPASGQVSTASAFARTRVSGKATFTGATSPALAGARVALQISSELPTRPWHSIAFARIDATGHFSLTHAFKMPGEISVRATAHSGRLMSRAVSEPLSYEVAQAQVSALTIHASADPLSAGQPVTISGAMASADGASVTLLARTSTGGFTPVAHSTTESLGQYSFTETPLENTYYEVTGDTDTSATLFVGVTFALSPGPQPAVVHAGEQLSLTGSAIPALPGQVVYLEREYTAGEGFQVVASGTVTDALSDYSVSYTPARYGASVLRLRVADGGKHLTAIGEPFTVTVIP